jgi:hypothetical protein
VPSDAGAQTSITSRTPPVFDDEFDLAHHARIPPDAATAQRRPAARRSFRPRDLPM